MGCTCDGCKPMLTFVESMCCQNYKPETKREIKMSLMLEQEQIHCICQHSNFAQFLDVDNLASWIRYYRKRHPDYFAAMDRHEKLRHVAYRRVIVWQFGQLENLERIPLPACVVTRIRHEFPSSDKHYKGFHYMFIKSPPDPPEPKISELLQTSDCMNNDHPLIGKVMAMQTPIEVDERVHKNRLRLVLADETDAILAFLTKPKPDWLKVGVNVFIWKYGCFNHTIRIHKETFLYRTGRVSVPDAISEVALKKFSSPQTPMFTIEDASALSVSSRVSISGRVIWKGVMRVVKDKSGKQKYVREVDLADKDATIGVTLWDASAVYAQTEEGDQLLVMDAVIVHNAYYRAKRLSVNFLDQIVQLPKETSTENLTLLGIDMGTDITNHLPMITHRQRRSEMVKIDIHFLHTALKANGPVTEDVLRYYFPIEVNAYIVGNCLTSVDILKHNDPPAVAPSGSSDDANEEMPPVKRQRLTAMVEEVPQPTSDTRDNAPTDGTDNETLPSNSDTAENEPTDTDTNETLPSTSDTAENVPIDAMSSETLQLTSDPAENVPIDAMSSETLPSTSDPAENASTDTATIETRPSTSDTAENVPIDAMSSETLPSTSDPAENASTDTATIETRP